MKLSGGERLILVMLSEIYKHHKIQGNVDPDLILESIQSNQTWALDWEYESLSTNKEPTPPVVRETCDILNMYRLITKSFKQLLAPEQERVRKEAGYHADYVEFQGFDGNNDAHFGVIAFFTKFRGHYDELGDHARNSHSRGTLNSYRRMLEKFQPMSQPYPTDGLTADQLIEILKP